MWPYASRGSRFLGDVIEISVRVVHLGQTSIGLAYEARRGRTVLYRAKNVVVVVDLKTMTKRPLSPRMRQKFQATLEEARD